MVLLDFMKSATTRRNVTVLGERLDYTTISCTENLSWRINKDLAKYFSGKVLGDVIIATSGMTIGNNELFLRDIVNGALKETFAFKFVDDRITLKRERERARLNILSKKQVEKIQQLERDGATRRNLRWKELERPRTIKLPHEHYRYYNKANSMIIYSVPGCAVYWKDDGDAVYTFKKNGNWYLHGVGGKKYFGRSGFTWSLIAPRMYTKLLPPGYILDSGAPAAFVRPGVDKDEIFFLMGWTLTEKCNEILKRVINHTRNIQGKDIERMPYPFWLSDEQKREIVIYVKKLINTAKNGHVYNFGDSELVQLEQMFSFVEAALKKALETPPKKSRS